MRRYPSSHNGKTDDHRLPLGSGSLIDLIITFKFYEHVSWLELRPTGRPGDVVAPCRTCSVPFLDRDDRVRISSA